MGPTPSTSRPRLVRQSYQLGTAGIIGLLTTSCSFLLDFDKLETRAECARCKGDDPCNPTKWCTDNACFDFDQPDENDCEPDREQISEPPPYERCSARAIGDAGNSAGPTLASGHRLAALTADVIGKTQVLVGQDFLYHVAYVVEGDKRDVVLRAFAMDRLATEPDPTRTLDTTLRVNVSALLQNLPEEERSVQSPGSIAVDTMNRVVLYVAHGRDGAKTATLSRVVLQADLSAPSEPKRVTDPPNYRVGLNDGRVGPAAGYLDNRTTFVAWQGCRPEPGAIDDLCSQVEGMSGGSKIFTHAGEELLHIDDEFGVDELVPVSALEAISDGTFAAAVWGTMTSSEPEVTLNVGVPNNGISKPLLQCFVNDGYALNSIHATPTYNGISSIVWSKRPQKGGSSSTEATSANCGKECSEPPLDAGQEQCGKSLYSTRVFENVRAAAHGVWLLDPSNSASDAVIVSAKVYDPVDAETRLTVTQSQGSPNPNEFPFLETKPNEHLVAEGTPDWPELNLQTRAHQKPGAAYSVVGVGWVEREKGRDTANLQTFDLCLEP